MFPVPLVADAAWIRGAVERGLLALPDPRCGTHTPRRGRQAAVRMAWEPASRLGMFCRLCWAEVGPPTDTPKGDPVVKDAERRRARAQPYGRT